LQKTGLIRVPEPKRFRGKRVLVAGAAGFLGSHLVRALYAEGASLIGVDNLSTGRLDNIQSLVDGGRLELHTCGVVALPALPGPLDFVFNLASPASPKDYQAMPIETLEAGGAGSQALLDLSVRKRSRYVLTSTSEVYGDPLVHPQPEAYWGNVNPVGPRSVYDEAKRYSEALTTAYAHVKGLNAGVARLFNTYGPRLRPGDGRVVSTFIAQALRCEGLTVFGDGQQTRSLCYVDDTVEGLLRLALSPVTEPVNIGNPHEVTVQTLGSTIIELCGSASAMEYGPALVDDPRRRCPDISRARALFDWQPRVDLTTGLQRTIRWMQEEVFALSDATRVLDR